MNLLTRFYQVELPGEFQGFLEGLGWRADYAARDAEATPPEVMERYLEYQRTIRAFMDSLADDTQIGIDMVSKINAILREGTEVKTPLMMPIAKTIDYRETAPGARVGFGTWKSARDLVLIPEAHETQPDVKKGGLVYYLSEALERLYTRRDSGKGLLAIRPDMVIRCAEPTCQNPFIRTTKKQVYCSTRCRQRQGQRERMKILFAK